MDSLAFLEDWGSHLDYGWFLAFICWGGVLAGFSSRRHWGRAMPWLAGFALLNMLLPVLEMGTLFTWSWLVPLQDGSRFSQRYIWDSVIGAVLPLAIVCLGLAAAADHAGWPARQRPVRWAIAGTGVLLAVFLATWRLEARQITGVLTVLLGAGAAWGAARGFRSQRLGRAWTLGLGLWALLPLWATTGPLAGVLSEGRHVRDLTLFSVPAQLVSLAAAVPVLIAVWRMRLGRDGSDSAWANARNALWLLAAWFAAGFVFVQWSAWRAREEYEAGLLRRTRMLAIFLDRSALEEVVGPKFQLGRIEVRPRSPVGHLTFSRVDYALSPAFKVVRDQLKRGVEANDDIWDFSICVERDGWMTMPVKWPDEGQFYTEVILTPPDERWPRDVRAGSAGVVLPPRREDWGNVVRAIVPCYDRTGTKRLAWLDAELSTSKWAEVSNVARLQAMGVLLTGVLLWATGVGLRQRRTEQKLMEERAATLAAADQAKGILLANVSHELRTPLQNIVGYAQLLQSEVTGERGSVRLAALRQEGRVMLRLVNDLLDLSAFESGTLRFMAAPTDSRRLIGEVVESFRPAAAAKGLALSFRADPALPAWVLVDPERLHQIAANLVSNAVKFTATGRVEVALLNDGPGGIELVVADTGPGIAPEEQAKLFKPFSRLAASRHHEGSGLGLALCAALCRQAGGGLDVESDGRTGTRFRARLAVRATTAPAENAPASPAALRGRRILVVDDNRLVRELFVTYLAENGVVCDQAETGTEALRLATAGGHDAVLLDLALPEAGGLEVATRLRADPRIDARLLIVGVSAHAGAREKEQALRAGFDAFLVKPVDLTELAEILALPRPALRRDRTKELMATFREMFRAEGPVQAAEVAGLLKAKDWPAVVARAHYLKGSAAVMENHPLFGALAALEEAALRADASAARAAWAECLAQLDPLLGRAECERLARLTAGSV